MTRNRRSHRAARDARTAAVDGHDGPLARANDGPSVQRPAWTGPDVERPAWTGPIEDWDRYFELFSFAPLAYALLDLNGVIREVNEAAKRLLGGGANTLVGHPLVAYVDKPDRSQFLEHMRRVRQLGQVVETELRLSTRDGRHLPVHISSRRSPRQDQQLCWTIMHDLGERRRLEDARRQSERQRQHAERDEAISRARNEAKDRFIGTLSHELRNPLAPALYAVEYLAELPDMPPTATRFLEMIRRNIEFEARLIDDLLDVTRINQTKLQLNLSDVDAHLLVYESAALLRVEADNRRLSVSLDAGATRSLVRADETRLRQVIWNLMSNALKFTPVGGRIVVRTTNDEHGALRISVADSGIGIEPDKVGLLFVPFEQIGRRSHGGLGLGLAISKGIIEAHGGRLWVTSRGLGEGATFEIELATIDQLDQPADTSAAISRRA